MLRLPKAYVRRAVTRLPLLVAGLLFAGVTGGARDARAAARTWNGGTGNWSDPTMWSGNSVPKNNDTVTIGSGAVTIDATTNKLGSLTITGGTVSVSGSSVLKINGGGTNFFTISGGSFDGAAGTVTDAGDLTISGGTFTMGAGTATVSGNVDVSATVTNGGDPTLVGYWAFDDTPNHTADSSANGNSLTWSGTPTFPSTGLPTLSFSDSNDVSMTGAQSGTTAVLSGLPELTPSTVTVSAWYKAKSVDTTAGEIVSGSNSYGLRITTTGVMVMKRIANGSTTGDWIEYRVPYSNVLDGNWHQIVGVISTGTAGAMTAYLDGVVATGAYWVNGSTAKQLDGTTNPTATAAAQAAIDWVAANETFGLVIGNNPSTTGYHFGGGTACATAGTCAIDDVRVYNRALTAADVAALTHGNQPASSAGVLTLAGSMSVTGSVTVQSTGTLTLSSGGSLAVGTALTMDGTLNATGATIKAAGTSYSFQVGSTSTAAPTLNINGLTVKNTDASGMLVNANTGANTTFTRFDAVAFSNGTAGAGSALLNINASTLYLTSNGCTFDNSTTYAVKLTGNGTGSGAGPRAMFGNATCATNDATTGLCATSEKSDDDANNDGVADHPTTNGAVVQFVRAAEVDTDGTLVGFPTAAFDWNSFTYYSTYVTFHDASSGSDVIYVRDEAGNPLYSWTDPTAAETITGTPQWNTVSGTHYLYVSVNGGASNSGKVYRLKDTGTGTSGGTLTLDASWATSGAYSCTCTITSDLSLDANNVYWAATTASAQVLMGLVQSSGAKISTSWPVTTPANVTTSSPTLSTVAGTTTLYLGVTADLLQLAVTGTTFVQDTKPGTITGRVSFGTSFLAATNGTSRVYAGDSAGNMTAISPTDFTGTHFLWSYAAGAAITNDYYDGATDTLAFGTSGGKVVVLNAAGSGTAGSLLNTSYPYTLDTSDPITAAPLYVNGVLAVGTTQGKLFLLDRNTGNATSPNGVSILQEYSFGPAQSVSTIGYDANVSRYMVSTSSAANDGRIYYFDAVADPTPTFQ